MPYFESKLTMLVKAAFGGNSRTSVIVNCRSDDAHGDETLQSLRFGERCSMVTNATVSAATTVASALASIDTALHACQEQV